MSLERGNYVDGTTMLGKGASMSLELISTSLERVTISWEQKKTMT